MLHCSVQDFDESEGEEESDEDEFAGEDELSEEGEDWDQAEKRLQKGKAAPLGSGMRSGMRSATARGEPQWPLWPLCVFLPSPSHPTHTPPTHTHPRRCCCCACPWRVGLSATVLSCLTCSVCRGYEFQARAGGAG